MDANQAYAEFRRIKHTLPFIPFAVETTDGQRFLIERRMGFAATPKMLVVLDTDNRSHWVKYPELRAICLEASSSQGKQ